VTTVKTLSIRRPIGDDPEVLDADREIVTASLGGHPAREPAYGPRSAATSPTMENGVATPQERGNAATREIDDYLWEVYQRQPAKRDRGGDFSWKDPAAAKRMGKTMQAYVILGMDADFREIVYHAGKAMDAAGIRWAILSAFRDDYRQSIASGLKAGASNSLHGGSARTGGYGHGRAVDVTSEDGDPAPVWKWLDRNGAKYGLHRPMPGGDPAHVQAQGAWTKIALALRQNRVGTAEAMRLPATKTAAAKADVAKASW